MMQLPNIKSDVMLKENDDICFAINLEDGEIYELNATAIKIFGFCAEQLSLDEAVARLAAECAIPGQEDVIRADVQETVHLFQELGLLSRVETTATAAKPIRAG